MPDFSEEKVGNRVYSDLHGSGKVVSVCLETRKICIKFDNFDNEMVYDFYGRWSSLSTRLFYPWLPLLHLAKPEYEEPQHHHGLDG